MQLVIDIGNSNIVFAVFQTEKMVCRFRISTQVKKTADEYAHLVLGLLGQGKINAQSIRYVAISSVVPPLDRVFQELAERYLDCKAHFVNRELRVPMRIDVETPEEVGADRLVNAFYAWRTFRGATIVIDMGTATTFDVINNEGTYLGGAIAPGIETASDALFRSASKINNHDRVKLVPPDHAIGKNTKEAIQSGVVLGYVGLIDFLVKRMKEEMRENARVISTGGLAGPLKILSSEIEEVNPDLTLCGLNILLLESIAALNDKGR